MSLSRRRYHLLQAETYRVFFWANTAAAAVLASVAVYLFVTGSVPGAFAFALGVALLLVGAGWNLGRRKKHLHYYEEETKR